MRYLIGPVQELEQLAARSVEPMVDAFEDIARGNLKTDIRLIERGVEKTVVLLRQTLSLADLLGRRRIILEADRAEARVPRVARAAEFASRPTPMVPPIVFEEYVADLLGREPRLAPGYAEVQRAYASEHVFALAKSADLEVTSRVRDVLARAAREGTSRDTINETVAQIGDWSRGYADTVYRTNLATSYSAGRFRQAADPDVAVVFGAFEYVALEDVDTRPNHAAADGIVAATKDPIWDRFSCPMGYRCRCGLEFVDRWELEERGLLMQDGTVRRLLPATFARAYPDPGFGRGRPDRRVYGLAG